MSDTPLPDISHDQHAVRRNKLAEMGMQTLNLGPREFQDFVQQEIRKWGPVIKAAQIKLD